MNKKLEAYYNSSIKEDEIINVEVLERGAGRVKYLEKLVSQQNAIIESQRKTIETIKRVNGILTSRSHERQIEIRGVDKLIKDIVNHFVIDMSNNKVYMDIDEWEDIINKHTGEQNKWNQTQSLLITMA